MSDLLDDFNKIFKKDFLPIFVKYFNDPNNKVTNSIKDFLNDPRISLTDIFEKFSKKKDNDINDENYIDIENLIDTDRSFDNEYDDLLKRLILIEDNMIQIEKILKDNN